jgi:hypothetical protein
MRQELPYYVSVYFLVWASVHLYTVPAKLPSTAGKYIGVRSLRYIFRRLSAILSSDFVSRFCRQILSVDHGDCDFEMEVRGNKLILVE